jgi:hypothetical protein
MLSKLSSLLMLSQTAYWWDQSKLESLLNIELRLFAQPIACGLCHVGDKRLGNRRQKSGR